MFANSVLGARTQKYPDLIDVCVALTGRAPLVGCHTAAGRLPTIAISSCVPDTLDFDLDLFWPLLGYAIGEVSGSRIPLIVGLESCKPRIADLKAFGAAFATTSSASMFHIRGVTPEHCILKPKMLKYAVAAADLEGCFDRLNTAADSSVGIVALGNPHFSFEEFEALASLVSNLPAENRHTVDSVRLMITTSRTIYQKVAELGILDVLERFGAELITDTCWCMIQKATIKGPSGRSGNIMTNSAKYAHYAPGLVGRKIHFGSLRECVQACVEGRRPVCARKAKREPEAGDNAACG